MNGKPCSIGVVTYTAKGLNEPRYQYNKTVSMSNMENYELTKRYRFIMNKRRRKGYEISRPVVTTAVRRNTKGRRRKASRCSNGCNDIRERSLKNQDYKFSQKKEQQWKLTRWKAILTTWKNYLSKGTYEPYRKPLLKGTASKNENYKLVPKKEIRTMVKRMKTIG